MVRSAIHEGLGRSMANLMRDSVNAAGIRARLGALASLTELDDLINISDPTHLDKASENFRTREEWMRSGV
jgi:serine-protein kinase ATM